MFNKSVASITKSFDKMVNDLVELSVSKTEEVALFDSQIDYLQGKSAEASLEAANAANVAEKIKSLFTAV